MKYFFRKIFHGNFWADIAVVNGNLPNLVPSYNVYSSLVYAARGDNVKATIVAGKVLFLNGEFRTLDAARTLSEAREKAKIISQFPL